MQKNKYHHIACLRGFFLVLVFVFFSMLETKAQILDLQTGSVEVKNDTTEIEDNPYKISKDTTIVPIDSARLKGQEDYRKYIMDTRYLALGDSLGKQKWYRDMFLQMGMGVENFVPAIGGYEFNTLNTFHLAVGKQFGKYHSLRLQGDVALGYQPNYDRMYLRLGGQLDHLFNLSSYLYGYNPSRILEIGTVVGVGLHWARLRTTGRSSTPYESHGGLQLRFYTGPHSVFNIEPYVMLASDGIDLSMYRNWHRYDVAYGVNANFVYYFDNHLSHAARNRILTKSRNKSPNRVTADSTRLYSWQAPWLFEIGAGASFVDIPEVNFSEKMGYEWALSGGKWFSSIIGLRATAMINTTAWGNRATITNQLTYEEKLSSFYVGTRLEGMFNPLGFLRSFRWDTPVGGYFVGGAGIGWLVKGPDLRCWSESYSAGLHLWARLTDGLQFFIEPRYTYRFYNVPYHNVQWSANFSDHSYGLNMGLTATNISRPYRRYETPDGERRLRMAAGLGGGIHMLPSNSRYKGVTSMPYNMNAFFEYRIDNASGMRLAFEFVKHNSSNLTQYYDLNMSIPEYGYAPMLRRGLWNYTYYLGLATLDYELNLTNAFCGYRTGRLFDFEAFVGPGLMWTLGRQAVLDERETLRVGHEARPHETSGNMCVAVNGGVKLTANVHRGFGITLTPQINYVPDMEIHGLTISRMKVLGTLDLGVQYQF